MPQARSNPASADQSGVPDALTEALEKIEQALDLLDEGRASYDIGAHLDFAAHRLRDSISVSESSTAPSTSKLANATCIEQLLHRTETRRSRDLTEGTIAIGWRIFGLGVIAVGIVSFFFGDFHPGQPVPKSFPDRNLLAYVANGFLIIAGAALQWRRFTVWAAAALAAYFGIVVVLLMDVSSIIRNPSIFGGYEGTAIEVAIAAAASIIYVANADIDDDVARLITRIGQMTFGACALVFGAAHFVYLKYTATLVPHWLPPSQTFWAVVVGIAHITAGLAILTNVYARLAAILLTIMFSAFTPLVHVPLLFSDPHKYFYWTENTINILLTGAAWVIADSLPATPAKGAFPRRRLSEGSA